MSNLSISESDIVEAMDFYEAKGFPTDERFWAYSDEMEKWCMVRVEMDGTRTMLACYDRGLTEWVEP